jgi:hypothetical protein
VFNALRREVIVRFVGSDGIVSHHCLNSLLKTEMRNKAPTVKMYNREIPGYGYVDTLALGMSIRVRTMIMKLVCVASPLCTQQEKEQRLVCLESG